MSEKTQRLDIVTPERRVYSGNVRYVVVPGTEGEMGFLPNHAPLVSGLKIGIVRVQDEEGKSFKVAISGGFVEVADSRVTILANTAERDSEIDRDRAEAAKARAEQRLASKSPDLDVARAELALKRALNRLKATS